MIAIIAEKPSVARDIARVLEVTEKKEGYIQGNGYMITWAYGHLVSLALPEDYGFSNSIGQLPLIPDPFKLIPRKVKSKNGYRTDSNANKQLKVIKSVFSKCEKIIVATDAGREGELIFRYIYKYLKCRKPFSRLWISSLTDTAVKEGFSKLKEGSDYDNLFLAAEARSKADWLLGINASRALALSSGNGNHSLGRVQTPTLALICKRYNENTGFTPQPFWQAVMHVKKQETVFLVKDKDTYFSQQEAEEFYKKLKEYTQVKVSTVQSKETKQQAPLLHDLTSLQKIANIRFGYSADKTLTLAQSLYERKFITYPRTGSRHIPEDVFEQIPGLINSLFEHKNLGSSARILSIMKLNKNCVDAKKVTDHHALLITGEQPRKLSEEETCVYDLIAGRMLEAFSKPCLKNVTDIEVCCDDIVFTAKGWTIKEKGWKQVFDSLQDEDEKEDSTENQLLPLLEEGEYLPVESHNLIRKSTKPKPLYTEAGLLSAMESAGKDIQDKNLKKVLKDCGIGTPATRAAIIETLFTRGYIDRHNKNLVPTKKGIALYNAVKLMRIADAELTASWEEGLLLIESKPEYCNSFMGGIIVHTKQAVSEIISVIQAENSAMETAYVCPKCRLGKVTVYKEVAKCNYSQCRFIIYRDICSKMLSDQEVNDLLLKGKTSLLKGFRNKKGREFEAYIVLDKFCKPVFKFPDKK